MQFALETLPTNEEKEGATLVGGMASQQLLTRWLSEPSAPSSTRKDDASDAPQPDAVVCLSGGDRLALRPWLAKGYTSLNPEIRDDPTRVAEIVAAHRGRIAFACAFPPCVDLALSGARWWKRKRAANPDFQTEAIAKLKAVERMLKQTDAPYCMLTPASATIKKLWKDPNAVITPYQYGGYLPEGHRHPTAPEAIPGRDRYHKKTYLFTGNGFTLPRRSLVTPVWVMKKDKATGKTQRVSPVLSKRNYRHARKLAPLGFLEAVAGIHGAPSLRA